MKPLKSEIIKPMEKPVVPENLYFKPLIDQVPFTDLLDGLTEVQKRTLALEKRIDDVLGNFTYQTGKWTIKQVLQHIVDCERVFCFRMLSIARAENSEVPGFDEHVFAENDGTAKKSISEIMREFDLVRKATIALIYSFEEKVFYKKGICNKLEMDVNTLAWFTLAHNLHHIQVIQNKYL